MAQYQTKTGVTPAEIRQDYLIGTIETFIKRGRLTEDFLWRKIRAQEDEIERDLGILWKETRIRSEPDPNDTDFDLIEPAYDYDSMFFSEDRWGYIQLRRAPVRSVQRVVLAYPNPDRAVFTLPISWVRLDQQFGFIRIVPDGASILANFTGYMFQVFSGGRGIPQSIQVDYTAGFSSGVKSVADSLSDSYADLLEHLKASVIADILRDTVMPNSFTVSTDGESQSISLQRKDILDEQHARRMAFKQKIKGIQMVVL